MTETEQAIHDKQQEIIGVAQCYAKLGHCESTQALMKQKVGELAELQRQRDEAENQ